MKISLFLLLLLSPLVLATSATAKATSRERRCRADRECEAVMCRSHCGFDEAVNKKFIKRLMDRCQAEKAASGADQITVECTPSDVIQSAKCIKSQCKIVEKSR